MTGEIKMLILLFLVLKLTQSIDKIDNGNEVAPTEDDDYKIILENPCLVRKCSNGSMCVITSSDWNKSFVERTKCICPSQCVVKYEPVCSIYGETFDSKCAIHKKACKMGVTIPISYEGECIVDAGACSSDELSQFLPRFMDWMLMVQNEVIYGEANLNNHIFDLSYDHHVYAAQWMYEYLDENKNKLLDAKEITSLLMYLVSVESCVARFVTTCDANADGTIHLREWKKCLLPASNSVESNFLFEN